MDVREVRSKYDSFAPSYDWAEGLLEVVFGIRRLRRRLLTAARGRVLEVGVGTGNSLRNYPAGCAVTGVDISRGMIRQGMKKNGKLGVAVHWAQMDTHRLAFLDDSFDTVVDTLCLCTYSEPVEALVEMARVCKPEGRILLLEHGRSNRGRLARLQDGWAARHESSLGCVWNREPQRIVQQAGLRLTNARRMLFGVFHILEAGNPELAG